MASSGLKSKDLVVLLVVLERDGTDWTYEGIGERMQMSASQVYYALERLEHARLYDARDRLVHVQALLEFFVHGVRYAFAVHPGELTRGIPTAATSPVGRELLASSGDGPGYVWPTPEGTTRGQRIAPLYDRIPSMLLETSSSRLHECLALIDLVRIGSAREREVAAEALSNRLSP